MRAKRAVAAVLVTALGSVNAALAGGGPLGIDRKLAYDNQGIWKRSNQNALRGILVGAEVLGALWEGSDTRLGKTFYQAIDASVLGIASSEVLKHTFRRMRPAQTDDPNQWFKHGTHSFPSGEVTLAASVVTPFVLEYAQDHPAAYALELIPLYIAVARMKVHAHWQTDVLAGWAIGTAAGYYAHQRGQSFTVGLLPRGITVGWRTKF
jgi:membrane-associated phospholipid phosphatase